MKYFSEQMSGFGVIRETNRANVTGSSACIASGPPVSARELKHAHIAMAMLKRYIVILIYEMVMEDCRLKR